MFELDAAGQGRRRDLELLKRDIERGISRREIANNHFSAYLMYNNGISKYQQLLQTPRDFKTKVSYLYGDSGTGKSRIAYQLAHLMGTVYYKSSGKWWDHYENNDAVVWDDFRGCDYRLSELLKLMDRYPYKVECKGAVLEFNSRLLIFTSNVMFSELYKEGNQPIHRRIDFYLNVFSYEDGHVVASTTNDLHDIDTFTAKYLLEVLFDL